MSSVDFGLFYDWCKERFGEENLRMRHTAHGDEICTHSFFAQRKGMDDIKYHLWMNVEGGKKENNGGAYRCWKTDAMGNLISLVANFDGIPYEQAESMICGVPEIRVLEQRVHEFFANLQGIDPDVEVEAAPLAEIQLPDYSFLIDGMSSASSWKQRAVQYLQSRKLPTTGMYVCTDGDFKNRIVIPYYDQKGKLIFYNARTMSDKDNALRYMKLPNGDQERVLYMTKWPPAGSKIYIMEGEFDAISMQLAGFVGCACGGKHLSDYQIELLRSYIPVLAFDNDSAGVGALIKVGNDLLERGFQEVRYIRPPREYKDWNKLLVRRNSQILAAFVQRFEKQYTEIASDKLRLQAI